MSRNRDSDSDREEGEISPSKFLHGGKHKLQRKWTLWLDSAQVKQTVNKYGSALNPVKSFDTVEDFWLLFNNIKRPAELTPSAAFYIFPEGVDPKWEDPYNLQGGSWTVTVDAKGQDRKAKLDMWWVYLTLACIGEQFEDWQDICGPGAIMRTRGDRIELWTKTAADEAKQIRIGKQLKEILELSPSDKISYSVFKDKLANQKAKDKYFV